MANLSKTPIPAGTPKLLSEVESCFGGLSLGRWDLMFQVEPWLTEVSTRGFDMRGETHQAKTMDALSSAKVEKPGCFVLLGLPYHSLINPHNWASWALCTKEPQSGHPCPGGTRSLLHEDSLSCPLPHPDNPIKRDLTAQLATGEKAVQEW